MVRVLTHSTDLRDQVDDLQELIRQTRDSVRGEFVSFPHEWHIRGQRHDMLRSLLSAPDGRRTHLQLQVAMVSHSHDQSQSSVSPRHVSVQLSRLRRQLKPLGVQLKTHWGVGVELDKTNRSKLLMAMEPADKPEPPKRRGRPPGVGDKKKRVKRTGAKPSRGVSLRDDMDKLHDELTAVYTTIPLALERIKRLKSLL